MSKKYNERPWHGFTDVHLDAKDLKALKVTASKPQEIFDIIAPAVEGGVKVSIQFDTKHMVFLAMIMGHDHADNEGWAMSARASSPQKAIAAVLYKHMVKFGGQKWERQGLFDFID